MASPHEAGLLVQRDPYSHLLSQQEKQSARCIPFRLAMNSVAIAGTSLYYMSRHNEIGRVKTLRISGDLVMQLLWRGLIAGVVADQVSRRLFVNRAALQQHKMATYEVKKVMRTWPNAYPYLAPH